MACNVFHAIMKPAKKHILDGVRVKILLSFAVCTLAIR